MAAVIKEWLGPPEPDAMTACKHLVVWAGAPQPIDGDVFAYLLEKDDELLRYLVVDFRNPENPDIREAAVLPSPSGRDSPHDRISEAEKSLAKEVGAFTINLGGGSDDGRAKTGFRLWLQDGQGSEEVLRKARHLTTLVCVDLEGLQVTDAWLAHLEGHPYIGSMTLRSTSITDRGLRYLSKSTGLKWLTLAGCGVTPEAVRALRTALPNCEIEVKQQ